MTKQQLDEIRQRDEQGFSESRKQWSTNRVIDSPSQIASDRHALLRYIDELTAVEPSGDLDVLRRENVRLQFKLDGLEAQQRDAMARGDEAMTTFRATQNRQAELTRDPRRTLCDCPGACEQRRDVICQKHLPVNRT